MGSLSCALSRKGVGSGAVCRQRVWSLSSSDKRFSSTIGVWWKLASVSPVRWGWSMHRFFSGWKRVGTRWRSHGATGDNGFGLRIPQFARLVMGSLSRMGKSRAHWAVHNSSWKQSVFHSQVWYVNTSYCGNSSATLSCQSESRIDASSFKVTEARDESFLKYSLESTHARKYTHRSPEMV